MKKAQGRKAKKTKGKTLKKAARATTKKIKKKVSKAKATTRNLLGKAKNKLKDIKKRSSKTFRNAKDKVHASEEEILEYVKENPVKSISAAALVGLIGGFLSRLRK